MICSIVLWAGLLGLSAPPVVSIEVEVLEVKSSVGNIQVGLYLDKKTFRNPKKRYKGAIVAAKPGTMRVTLEGVPSGTYAIGVWHDANKNGIVDKSLVGIPSEGYGFSNDAQGFTGPPDFEDATFVVDATKQKTLKLKVRLSYY